MRKPVWGSASFFTFLICIFVLMGLIGALVRDVYIRFLIIIAAAIGIIVVTILFAQRKKIRERKASIILEKEKTLDKYINSSVIPTVIIDGEGKIIWQNPAFGKLLGYANDGKNIYILIPDLGKPDKLKLIDIGGTRYKRDIKDCAINGERFELIRLVNEEKIIKTVNANRSMLPVVCDIEIDNYRGTVEDMPLTETAQMMSAIDEKITEFAAGVQGMLLKYEDYKYLVCFENKYLRDVRDKKFSLLDEVRGISTSDGVNPTLSIAIGSGESPKQSAEFAKKAMELATGRGGDQAVIKDNEGHSFYGGVQHAVEVKNKIRSRTVSKALRNLMEQSEDILIMGHANPDMDCIGAALGISACARLINKQAYIILDRPNAAIETALEEIRQAEEYKSAFITTQKAHQMLSKRSLLIVVDTQTPAHTMDPLLLQEASNVVVLDHHLKGTSTIENAVLFFHEPYASSTAEMVTELVEYFSDRIHLKRIESEALMVGIVIDTKGFTFKTGVRTFEAASYLRRNGATTTTSKQLIQDDLATFIARADVVKGAEVKKSIAIGICPKDSKAPELLAAQSADELLNIKGVNASFVLVDTGEQIAISGRSLGEINVQLILEKMGGGGHATIAGAQVKGKQIGEVKEILWKLIDEYKQSMNKN